MNPAEKHPWSNRRVAFRLLRRGKKLCDLVARSPLLVCAATFITLAGFPHQGHQPAAISRYIGNDKCLSCHQEQKAYPRTAHHLTSRPATQDSIAGKFGPGENILKTSEPELHYRMEARKDGFYQTAVLGTPPDTASISERFDFVVGSGRKGQTYLYWGKGDRLFQLPVSYWTAVGKWVPSPGYDDKVVNFSRPVLPRCLECHASFFEPLLESNVPNRYRKSDYVLGVSCERCHGPGAEHAALNLAKDAKPTGQAIVNPAKLSRERQLGLCSLCHGGIGVAKAPAFSYVVGKELEDYIRLELPKPDEVVDVHGSQVALLVRSRCFKSSTMTCSTCHNVHLPQRDVKDFSARCLACHKIQSCGLYPQRGNRIAGKCIDCHLPNQSSNVIVSTIDGVQIRPQVRNHWIKVYPGMGTR
jgi:cytochrome c554/c'-like protein